MTTIQTREHRDGIKSSLKLTHYPHSTEKEVRQFLNSRGMKEVIGVNNLPQKVTEYKLVEERGLLKKLLELS